MFFKRMKHIPITTKFKIGDEVYYRLSEDRELLCKVVNITHKRIVVRPIEGGTTNHIRSTIEKNLRLNVTDGKQS